MNYILLAASFLFFGSVAFVINKFCGKKSELIQKIIMIVLIALFAVRFMSYLEVQLEGATWEAYQNFGPGDAKQKLLNLLGELCLWFGTSANLFLFLRPFFKTSTSRWYVKFISLPVLIVECACMYQMLNMMIGTHHTQFADMQLVEFLLPIELGGTLALSLFYFVKDWNTRISKVHYREVAIVSTVGNFFTMPAYVPMFLFGQGPAHIHLIDLNIYHRIGLYAILITAPLIMYFLLRSHSFDKKRYLLIFFTCGVMCSFAAFTKYDVFKNPWDLPLHLCNTAAFIMPICFIFLPKRLFYFTYFINVFGAMIAILMPTYNEYATMFDPDVIRFWQNHMFAFYMPLMGVALKIYERPKLKQYFYSVMWFAVYFVLVAFLNGYFTGLGHRTDFFFTNVTSDGTNYILGKLNSVKAFEIFNRNIIFNIKGVEVIMRPLFLIIYFAIYVLIGFGMWFVYLLFFDISDSHYALHIKLKGIRQDQIALQSVLNGRSIEEPMEKEAGIKLELDHFSKKYGANKHYSVHDVSFEVHAGEVFGFLGPNGAGKSTIIKSLVGIQPITEGKMRICGYDVQSQPVQAKSNVGFVPDHYALYEKLTGREYINYIADIFNVSNEDREQRINYYVKLFELEASIDNKIKTYSHGMKQKITIISALVHNPKVWILDEPLTGLDPTSIYQVKQCMIKHAEAGNIVFFSSHLIDIVEKLCDRVGVIKHGELQKVDTVKNIEKEHGSLEKFYLKVIGDNVTKVDE